MPTEMREEYALTAKIAVKVSVFSLDKPYSYFIPSAFRSQVHVGTCVLVPFGRSDKTTDGVVLSVGEEEIGGKNYKPILALADREDYLTQDAVDLALWMRTRFFCTVYDALQLMLPVGYKNGVTKRKQVWETFWRLSVDSVQVRELIVAKERKAKGQAAVLRTLAENDTLSEKELCAAAQASVSVIKALASQKLVCSEKREIRKGTESQPNEVALQPEKLTAEQSEVFSRLADRLRRGPSGALLYGVTGSGKTVVYLELIRKTLESGKNAILLVPEIALTPQLVRIFRGQFGGIVAVLHSSLSDLQRTEEWFRIRSGEARVVIGTRSAVFAPVRELGLMILDEEQEASYHSSTAPRYHARDVARYRCGQSKALLLLGSATPSIESMYDAEIGKLGLYELTSRYNGMPMPKVMIADRRSDSINGNFGSIGSVLQREIAKNLTDGRQSILFLNRRGSSTSVQCVCCGTVAECPNCSVSLTYHSVNRRLRCHYCGYSRPAPEHCPTCGGVLKYSGIGTQKVEEELRELFPGVEMLRMDADTVNLSSHQQILQKFREEKIPILLGTQMVAKGLDFSNVTLVGVISVDGMLYMNDYKARERTFDLLTQVVGRSGRGSHEGRAVIQTYTPEHEVIRLASEQDYLTFYHREIALRRGIGCPPFTDMFGITVTGKEERAVQQGSEKVYQLLNELLRERKDVRLMGPMAAAIARVKNKYRYKVLLSCGADGKIRNTVSYAVKRFAQENKGLSVYAECNPDE